MNPKDESKPFILKISKSKDKFNLITTNVSKDDTLILRFFSKVNNFS